MSKDYLRMRSKFWALALLISSSCTKPNPASCLDDFCSDPALPFCDVDGSIGGVPDTCIAVQCAPGEFKGCRDDNALICNETGTNIDETACEFGCAETGCLPCNTADCQPVEKHIIPNYLPTICDNLETNQLTVLEDATIDTSVDANCTSIVAQSNGPGICVVHVASVAIDRNKTLSVRGSRVFALVADRELLVDGILDVSATASVNGPGGGFKKSGSGEGAAGGGAGGRHPGAPGATATVTGGAANGGPASANPGDITVLFGGAQSVKGSMSQDPGGGGGGVTLISCRGSVTVPGIVDAGGGGGDGDSVSLPRKPPGGGGAGGNVVIQGMKIEITGQLFANGGGGGGSGTSDMFNSAGRGQDGQRSLVRAPGGAAANGGGAGGAGGTLSPPINGFAMNDRGGAGGGSAGFLLTYTPDGETPMIRAIALSPDLEPNRIVPTN